MPNQAVSFEEDKVTHEPVAILNGRFRLADLVNLLSEMQKRTGKMAAALTTGGIEVIPIVSHSTGMPMVELQSPAFDQPIQLDADQALEFGHTLVEVVAMAMNDAALFNFFSRELEMEKAATMLYTFRRYRDQMLTTGDQDKPS